MRGQSFANYIALQKEPFPINMCLLFYNINDSCKSDEFRLVLVNNRDEFWQRPTQPANFWNKGSSSCISGLDAQPGRAGGTWLGANRQGRIACLVNISAQQDDTKEGRGFLVTDFLTKGDTVQSYGKQISDQSYSYNGFILTLIELDPTRKSRSSVVRVTNDKLAEETLTEIKHDAEDCLAVGNSPVKRPWIKVSKGRESFEKIVQGHGDTSRKDQLKEELFKLMHESHRYWPDPQLQRQADECRWDSRSTETKSSIFVWDTARQYGTRTTTVLLVDAQGNCDYTERTLQTPVDTANPQWSTANFKYSLHGLESSL